jgi:hypothetical protein
MKIATAVARLTALPAALIGLASAARAAGRWLSPAGTGPFC